MVNKNSFIKIDGCRTCSSKKLDEILNLGDQPLANSLLNPNDISKELYFPLILVRCDKCSTLQLSINVDPKILFNSYFWVTGTSNFTKAYCADLARNILSRTKISKPKILEVGSNDGTLLSEFEKLGVENLFGVDPAENVIPETSNSNIKYIPEFFTEEFTKQLIPKLGQFDIVIARNVLSHVPNLNDVVRGISSVLKKDGICVIEFHDANKLMKETQYDSIYHEHTYYHSIKSMTYALLEGNLIPYDGYTGPISGGSVIIFSSHQNKESTSSFKTLIKEEESLGVYEKINWEKFAINAKLNIDSIKVEFQSLKKAKRSVCAFGASARSSTLLNAVGIESNVLTGIADNNQRKWGQLSPGIHLEIVDPKEIINKNVKTIFINAFNFEKEITTQIKKELNWSGQVIVPLPNKLRKYEI